MVKSHGVTDATGFAAALGLAGRIAASNVLQEVEASLDKLARSRAGASAAAVPETIS